MKLTILLLLMTSCATAQLHPKYVQLVGNRERIMHYVPDMYRLVRQITTTTEGSTNVPVNMGIGMTISNKAVAYVLNETDIDVKSYTLQPAKVDAGRAAYIKGYTKNDGYNLNTWSIDGWIPICIKNDTLLMQQTLDDVTTIRYWKKR